VRERERERGFQVIRMCVRRVCERDRDTHNDVYIVCVLSSVHTKYCSHSNTKKIV
jgi:hypothetical protein